MISLWSSIGELWFSKRYPHYLNFLSWLTLFFSATHEIGVRLALTIYNALKKDFSCYTVSLNVTKIKGWYEEGETLQLLLIWTFIQKIEQSVIRHAIVWCNSHQAARDAWQIKAQTAVVQGFGAPRYEKVAWRRLGYLEMAERIMPYADAQWCIPKGYTGQSKICQTNYLTGFTLRRIAIFKSLALTYLLTYVFMFFSSRDPCPF